MTGFGSFDNSTCKRVLGLLEPGDMRLGQLVIKKVAVVKLGVNIGSGDGRDCFGIEVLDGYVEADEYGNSRIYGNAYGKVNMYAKIKFRFLLEIYVSLALMFCTFVIAV